MNPFKQQQSIWSSKLFGLPLFLSLLIFAEVACGAAPPNVVVFLADDAGWGDYHQSGNQQIATPRIDSLAKEGVSFDRFFVCPVCSPTRAEFLTGRYYPRTGVRGVSAGFERLNLDETTVAEAFQGAGYATGAFGKWHNGSQWPYHPRARGFDQFFGYTAGHWGEYINAPLEDNGQMVRTEGYIVDVCTDRALKFIDQNRARPFFCYIPFTTPHSPWRAPDSNWDEFKQKEITQRATEPEKEVLNETRCALAMMENQDWNVGRVLTRLEELGLQENTIVLYFSDNGPNTMRWNGGMKGKKGGTDEGSVRSVCYLRWPAKLPAGLQVKQIAGAIDLLPTLTSLAGVKLAGQKPLDGKDLSPLLAQQATEWPDRMLFSLWGGRASVRNGQYRLDANGNLYDIPADPAQTFPLNQRQREIADSLTAALKNWRADMTKEIEKSHPEANNKKPEAKRNTSVDPRPIPVGYREFPITMLPARDGEPRGGVKRSSSAPNSSYFVHWTDKQDRMEWLLNVRTTGQYEVSIDCTCPEAAVGAVVEVAMFESRLSYRIAEFWDPALYTNQDTLPRPPGESQMKEFRTVVLGEMRLTAGQGVMTLRALEIPGSAVMDVRRITLRLTE